MTKWQNSIRKFDSFQQRHHSLAFPMAVIKRYSDDQIGYQAALLTYYAFLALFPLLLVLTTLTQLIANSQPALQARIISGVTDYFPVLGGQLSAHIHSLHRNGVALVIGLLFVFYGARGVAVVFQHGVNEIWHTKSKKQRSILDSTINSFIIVIIGGVGFITASVIAGLAAAAGHEFIFRVISELVNVLILFCLFSLLYKLSLPGSVTFKETRTGSVVAAVGLVILQSIGGYLLTRELRRLDALYSYFAIALGLIFWVYLQVRIVYYSIEIATVKSRHLWPRSLSD
jgi:membrane protein